jgi:hypothetical protein
MRGRSGETADTASSGDLCGSSRAAVNGRTDGIEISAEGTGLLAYPTRSETRLSERGGGDVRPCSAGDLATVGDTTPAA